MYMYIFIYLKKNSRIIPESVRWLLTQKKYDRAKTIIQRIAKFNKRNIPEDVKLITSDSVLLQNGTEDHASGENLKKREYTPSVLDMFKNKVLFKRSVILFYIWYVYYVVFQTIIRCQGRTIKCSFCCYPRFSSHKYHNPRHSTNVLLVQCWASGQTVC